MDSKAKFFREWECVRLLAGSTHSLSLEDMTAEESTALLDWLDASGLATHLWAAMQGDAKLRGGLAEFERELAIRATRNRKRVEEQLEEFENVVRGLHSTGLPYAVLKGFSLVPAFCRDPYLRNQLDIDILTRRSDAHALAAGLAHVGYEIVEEQGGDIVLLAPYVTGPIPDGDVYEIRERKVEIHTTFFDDAAADTDALLKRREVRRVRGIEFPSLAEDAALAGQILHVARHLGAGFVRLSWLYEIHTFLSGKALPESALTNAATIVHKDSQSSLAPTITLRLVQKLFGTQVPDALLAGSQRLPQNLETWIRCECEPYLFSRRFDTPSPLQWELTPRHRRLRVAARALKLRARDPISYFWPKHHHDQLRFSNDLRRAWSALRWKLKY